MAGTFITTPTLFEKQFYKDVFTCYVSVIADNETAEIAGWTVANLSPTQPIALVNIACNFHSTQNFDLIKSMLQSKIVNEMTTNLLSTQYVLNIPADSRINITTRWGRSYWFKSQGSQQNEVLMPCTDVFLAPTKVPKTFIPA